MPDYACLIVGANMGVVGMCKEHLGVALALKVPVFFVVTKVDICPEHVLKNTVQVRTWGCSHAGHISWWFKAEDGGARIMQCQCGLNGDRSCT